MKLCYQSISDNDYLSLPEAVLWLVSVLGDRRRLSRQQNHALKWLLESNPSQSPSRGDLINCSYHLDG